MNTRYVMEAIAGEMERCFEQHLRAKEQGRYEGSTKERMQEKVKALHEAYFELRGREGMVCNVAGCDGPEQDVDAIYSLMV